MTMNLNDYAKRDLTIEDLVLRTYEWTKVSRFAVIRGGRMLIRYDGEMGGMAVYSTLKGTDWVLAREVGIAEIAEADPVTREEAIEVILRMRREERGKSLGGGQ